MEKFQALGDKKSSTGFLRESVRATVRLPACTKLRSGKNTPPRSAHSFYWNPRCQVFTLPGV